jgi:hypothetical protein
MLLSQQERMQTMAEKRPRARKARKKEGGTGADAGSERLPLEGQIDVLIVQYIEALRKNEIKLTVADLIRLRKLQRELSPKRPAPVDVVWVDGWT